MKNKFKAKLTFLIALLSTFLFSFTIKAEREKFKNTDMYDFAQPKIINIPQALDEISGIAHYQMDTSIFASSCYKNSTFCVLVSNGDVDKLNFVNDKIKM